MEAVQWYIVALVLHSLIGIGCFLLGRRSNRMASGVTVPPSPEVVKKIAERLKEAEALSETSESIIADINALLGIKPGTGG